MTWLRTLLLGLAALLGVADAAAHATLLSTAPADGAPLWVAPAEIVLRFDEPVAPLAMQLVDDAGASLALAGGPRAEGSTVRIPMPAMRRGAFIFSYRVASADAHPVGGAIAFTVGDGATAFPRAVAPAFATSTPSATIIFARALRDLLVLVAGGAALFAVCVGAFPFQRAVLCMAGAGAVAMSAIELGVQGAALLGPRAAWDAAFRAAAGTTAGLSSAGIFAGAVAIVLGGWMAQPRLRAALLCVGGIMAPASLALTGHAASATPAWLSTTAVAAHALVAAFWVGSLVTLRLTMRSEPSDLVPVLRRFSLIAMPAVGVLLAAGTAFAAMQIDSIRDLAESRYGNLVLLKAALLIALLAVAAANRFVITPRLARGEVTGRMALARAVSVELALVVIVVAVTAVLSRTSPRDDLRITAQLTGSDLYHGRVTVFPSRAGRNSIVVDLRDRENRPLDPDETRLRLANPRTGIEPIERPMVREGAGRFRHEGSELAFPGTWSLAVEGRVGEFDRFKLQARIEIR